MAHFLSNEKTNKQTKKQLKRINIDNVGIILNFIMSSDVIKENCDPK